MTRTLPKILLLTAACAAAAFAGPSSGRAFAVEHHLGFDDEQPSWTIFRNKMDVRLIGHRRNRHIRLSGRGSASEQFVLQSAADGTEINLQHALPPARAISDLSVSLWVRSNRNGAAVWLRVVFPHQKDPTTGAVLSTWIRGDAYTTAGTWQKLTCTTSEKLVARQIHLVRARLTPQRVDVRDPYVDRVIVSARLDRGAIEIFLDELQFGPVVPPDSEVTDAVQQAGQESSSDGPPVKLHLSRLMVEGQPFFPRISIYHGEPLDVLQQTKLNLAWIPDHSDRELLQGLRQHGLWAVATPPRAATPQAGVQRAEAAEIPLFDSSTAPILLWNVGTRVPAKDRHLLAAWHEQIRRADRNYNRPVMADVSGLERIFSRHVRMLGSSRHVINTTFEPKRYRDWLIQKRKLARPGTLAWTWIQTEPATANARWRRAAGKGPIVVEPEQLRLQVYAALAANYRGIGYWKSTPLDATFPGAAERRLAMTQLNLELNLIEQWLATSTLVDIVGVQIADNSGTPNERTSRDARTSKERPPRRRRRENAVRRAEERNRRFEGEIEAAIFHCDDGKLVLPVWYGKDAQFVPGQMSVNDVRIVVPTGDQSAAAWSVSTTSISSLEHRRVAGGIEVTLPRLDQTAIIFLSSDLKLVEIFRRRIEAIAPLSAKTCLALAEAKLERVQAVDEELQEVGAGQPESPYLFSAASDYIGRAQASLDQGDYDTARTQSAAAMQLLRILQRIHWDFAVARLASPMSSPYTVAFQTLPDHWRLIAQIGKSEPRALENLLVEGDFEQPDQIRFRWEHAQNQVEGIRAAAELYPVGRNSGYSLRLVAVPETGVDTPKVVTKDPIIVSTPAVTVRDGQIVHISGWIHMSAPVSGNLDGVMIYDNLSGPLGALRWHAPEGWRRFELIREVRESGPLKLTVALTGMGEVHLDDLAIVAYTPRTKGPSQAPTDERRNPDARPRPLRFFDRWSRLRPLGSRTPSASPQE